MAELLIYNSTSWMDLLDSARREELRAAGKLTDRKYAMRWQSGQTVEVQDDGFFTNPQTGRGWDRKTFRLLCVRGLTRAQAKQYLEPGTNARLRYRIESGSGQLVATLNRVKDLQVTDLG